RGDCETPMEFLTTKQYMIKIKDFAPDLIKAAKRMNWYPAHFLRRATDWIGALEWDWIISRQRVFGTPIPFWSCSDCNAVIPPPKGTKFPLDTSLTPAPTETCPECGSKNIKGTEDVCDCWVDSSITALTISRWFSDPEFAKRWITKDSKNIMRLQGHDIIRTWYTYTTFRTMKLTNGLLPYGNVLINGHVLGPNSMKMSKSKGNVVDPREGIEKYGADAIRQTILSRKVGSDFPFLWDTAQYGKSFLQKIWSVSRFFSSFIDDIPVMKPKYSPIDTWLLSEFEKARKEITDSLDAYEFHVSLKILYDFIWNKLCDNYLESVKPILRSENIVRATTVKKILHDILWSVLRLLAPFCPHITDEIYLKMFKEEIGKISIHGTDWPKKDTRRYNAAKVKLGEGLIDIIAQARQQKASMRIALNQPIKQAKIFVPEELLAAFEKEQELIKLPTHISELEFIPGEDLKIELLND
ncbi:MAG: class I tRNA ligase family protein, partial [Candidatus Heimdallarchaeota archaeon]